MKRIKMTREYEVCKPAALQMSEIHPGSWATMWFGIRPYIADYLPLEEIGRQLKDDFSDRRDKK